MEEQLVQTAAKILPFATMEKITKLTKNTDSKELLKLMKILWANDLIGHYEVKKVLGEKRAQTVKVNALRKGASIARGIYVAYPLITEQEYYLIVKNRDVLLKDSHSKQITSLKGKIENLYAFTFEKGKILDPKILLQKTEILKQKAKALNQEMSIIEELLKKVKDNIQAVQSLKDTLTNIKVEEMLDNLTGTLIYVETILEAEAEKGSNIVKAMIVKSIKKDRIKMSKIFYLLPYCIKSTELLLIELERIMNLLLNDKEIKLRDINSNIQEMEKVSSTLVPAMETVNTEKEIS